MRRFNVTKREHEQAERLMWAGRLLMNFSATEREFLRQGGFLSERDEAIFDALGVKLD